MALIEPISKSQLIDYSDKLEVSFWLIRSGLSPEGPVGRAEDHLQTFFQQVGAQAEVICVASRELANPLIAQWCAQTANRGKRVYLLTGQPPQQYNDLVGSCLMRFDLPIAGSFILVDPQKNPRGLFYNGTFGNTIHTDGGYMMLEMDAAQVWSAFHFFSYHFWNSAKIEIIGQSADDVRACPPSPFSITQPESAATLIDRLLSKAPPAFASGSWNARNWTDSTLLTHVDVAAPEVVRQSNRLFANDQPSPLHCICTHEAGFLLPSQAQLTEELVFALALNPRQFAFVQQVFDVQIRRARYECKIQAKRRDLQNCDILRLGSAAPVTVRPSATRNENLRASQFLSCPELEALKPEFVDDGISCVITYKWSIDQFQIPVDAKLDPLYEAWRNKQKTFAERIDKLQGIVNKAKNESEGIATNLKKFLTGFFPG